MIYNGVEYQGEHEAIISLETWEKAQDEIAIRSVIRSDSNYLLSGLLFCGECGAKMRYQKWDKKTGECKLICYSQQKSKKYLVKDENCENHKYWQSDIENAVISKLFDISCVINKENRKMKSSFNPIEALTEELSKEQRKLSRLYDFEDTTGEPDDILTEKILNSRKRINDLKLQIDNEIERKRLMRKIKNAENLFRNLKGTWNEMTQKEKQAVCQELIEKIIVNKNGSVDVYLRLRSYLANNLIDEAV